MATYQPPTENLPIFDPVVFLTGDEALTYNEAVKKFLKYPSAQGKETLQAIDVNGISTFNATSTFNDEIVQVINKRITQAISTDNNLQNTLRPTNIYGDLNLLRPTGAQGGALRLYDVTSSTSGKSFQIFDSGNTASIVNLNNGGAINLNVRDSLGNAQDALYCTYNQVSINANLVMNNAISTNRQISTGYLNLNPITGSPGGTGTQIYQSNTASYWDNNTNGGTITFATNTTGGVQVLPLNITPTFVETNLPFKINVLGNFLQFPDGTQQTTAYTGSTNLTYSSEFTTSGTIPLPANLIGIGVRLVGQGGIAGVSVDSGGTTWNAGGSGGGASTIMSNNILPITSGSLTLTVINSSGGSIELFLNGVSICKAFNGNNGGNASGSLGGTGGSAQTQTTSSSNYGTFTAVSGSAGVSGITNIPYQDCGQIPTQAGKPNYYTSFSDGLVGCGQRYSSIGGVNQCPIPTSLTGCKATITYYLK